MSRIAFNQSRIFMRKSFAATPSFTNRAFLSTGLQRLQQQQQQQAGKNTTHFGFRDVAEEDKESLGKLKKIYERRLYNNFFLRES